MKMLKKAVTAVITFAIAVSAVSSMACAKDSFMGYDQDNLYTPDAYGKLYYCPESNEVYVNGYAAKVEWKHAYYEADYPFLEVVELYLDDNATGKTRYAGIPDGVTELKPEFWEAKYPYEIYSRLYAGMTSASQATDIVVDSETTEAVKTTYDYAGFDIYANVNGVIKDVSYLYAEHAEKFLNDSMNPVKNFGIDGGMWTMSDKYYAQAVNPYFDAAYAGQVNPATGKVERPFVDEFYEGNDFFEEFFDGTHEGAVNINDYVSSMNWLKLEGPDYYTGGSKYVDPMYDIISGKPCTWYDDTLVMPGAPVKYEWKTVGYEAQYPYRYYQVLYVNDVPMDGDEVELVGSWTNVWNYDETLANSDAYDHYQIDLRDDTVGSVNVGYDWMTDDVFGDVHVVNRYKLQAVADRTRKPYIFRYTGGCASPKVEWKYAFTEAAYPHALYEQLYLDGQPALHNDGSAIIRPTGENAESIPSLDYRASGPRYYKVNITSPYAVDVLNEFVASNFPLHDYNMIVSGDDYYIPFSATNLFDGHTKIATDEQKEQINAKIANDLGIKVYDDEVIESVYWWAIENGYNI